MLTAKRSRSIKNLGHYTILIIFSFFVLVPILWMVSTAIKTEAETFSLPLRWIPEQPTFGAFKRILIEYPFGTQFKNSFINASLSTVITLICSTLAGYGITRFKFKGKKTFMSFLLVSQMFPAVMLLVPFYTILRRFDMINTHVGIVFVYISMALSFSTWMMTSFFNDIPRSLDEAATIDGCSKFQVFLKVIMPLTMPGMTSVAIYAFIMGWNDFLFASTLITHNHMKTLTVGIAEFSGQYNVLWNDLMAASIVASIPLIIMFTFFQKYFISGMTAGAVKQ
ncbi:carbohydrate ABC transporter permease [Vallitalea pronyensis]|uniref:Carbohydrate ABC transporter permease n=1 Tax=Vallitalea pronyensis TaxID=1348613 RepID=A0A8J8SIS6_9FIRM|nr:carbohydrate ABC transporter permease [Vallitalea pronyensis]QUI25240.1 carbohydrate ABC transporter permease [Vallitalea pronyensis]